MSTIFNNIGQLREDLKTKGWHMTAFQFVYKGIIYDVLFENNENLNDRINMYGSVTLHFIDSGDINRTFVLEANQAGFIIRDKKAFREFFNINYSPNLGEVFKQMFVLFLKSVPLSASRNLSNQQNMLINRCLADRGGHNPNAIFCYDARRLGLKNGKQMYRSVFIDNLTQRVKPKLYQYFKNEKTVTFYYSDNPQDELDDISIINRFIEREY